VTLQEPSVVEPVAQPFLLPEVYHPIGGPGIEEAVVEGATQRKSIDGGGLEFESHGESVRVFSVHPSPYLH